MILTLVYVYFYDGSRDLLMVQPKFDVERWAQSRAQAFKTLGVVKIHAEDMEAQ